MTLLGIDYGTKKIGIAVSDAAEKVALPLQVITNDARALEVVHKLLEEYGVRGVVFGASFNLHGKPNPVHEKTVQFATILKQRTPTTHIFFTDERYSTREAHEYTRPLLRSKHRGMHTKKTRPVDAHAAAIILQQFLEAHTQSD